MSEYDLKPSAVFWVLAIFFVVWNIIGCSMYLLEMTMSDEAYSQAFGPEVAGVRDLFPLWGLSSYAIAVWSGLLAAILFLLRRRLSVLIFCLSLGAAIISFIPSFMNETLREAYGPTFWVMPLIVTSLGIAEVFYSRKQSAKGILR
jgi:hypothetical protein